LDRQIESGVDTNSADRLRVWRPQRKCQPGNTVAIVGAGPIGLSALLTAQFYSPAEIIMIDVDDNRLEVPKEFGATSVINNTDGKAVGKVMALTGNRGVDVAIEAIRIPVSLQ
jgi:alcohol dehydrogenase